MNSKILHIGPMPPPLGGISVYLYRLSRSNNDNSVGFVNENNLNGIGFLKLIFLNSDKTFIYHSPSTMKRIALLFSKIFRGNKYIIVSHGEGLQNSYKNSNFIMKFLLKSTIFKSEHIQVVSSHLVKFLLNLGLENDKIIVKNAFLPPVLCDEESILKTYPPEIFDFISKKDKLLVANASSLVFYKNTDLYGLDICIELTAKLKNDYPNLGFIFALANEKVNTEYIDKMHLRIRELNLEENFYFLTGQKELWPIFKKASLMIRPTNTDGYGISIAEALYFGCPAIASDVCDRPTGTILFKNRNLDDLYDKTKRVLDAM